MAKKLPDLQQAGLGDLSHILHNQGVADLSWLAVDEKSYRAFEALPRQNLDIIPELQKALSSGDEGVPQLIPLKPHTIVNRNPVYHQSTKDTTAPIRNRVAKFVMAGMKPSDILDRLGLEYSSREIALSTPLVADVLKERGLLGNVYVNSTHFPRCAQGDDQKFVANNAKRASYVLAKDACVGCVHNRAGQCSIFKKTIVDNIPYDNSLLAKYSPQLASEKRVLSHDGDVRSQLREAFLKSPIHKKEPVQVVHTQRKPVQIRATLDDVNRVLSQKVRDQAPSPEYVKYARRMMQGHDDFKFLSASTNPDLRRLASHYGILGHTYFDIDVFGGCRNLLAFIRSKQAKSIQPDFFVRTQATCTTCKDSEDGSCACLRTVSPIISSYSALTKENLFKALKRAVSQKRFSVTAAKVAAQNTTSQNMVSIISFVNLHVPKPESSVQYSSAKVKQFIGSRGNEYTKSELDHESVRKFISHSLNTGVSRPDFMKIISGKYTRDDLIQFPDIVRYASENTGVQGYYFIDPTAYHDYGRGCDTGASHFRKRGAKYVLTSDQCTGCRLQTAPGWCSKYSKELIRQVPNEVRQQIAAFRKLPVIQPSKVENPVEKYQLSSDLPIDINGSKSRGLSVSISSAEIDIK